MYNCKRSNYRSIRKNFEGLIGRRIVLNEQQSGSRIRLSGVPFNIFEEGFDRQRQWKDHFWFICIFLGFTMKICFGYYKHSLINQAEVDKNINHKQSQNSHEHVKQLPFEYMNMLFTNC